MSTEDKEGVDEHEGPKVGWENKLCDATVERKVLISG